MKRLADQFWHWYERHYLLNITLSAGLFVLQLFHLYWLTTHVVLFKLLGQSYFDPSPGLQYILIAVDYTEIPALIATSAVYLHDMRKGVRSRALLYLLFLNTQWLHLFWITDEFVVNSIHGAGTVLPLWLAWVAIVIDYLELPVIADTVRRFVIALRKATKKAGRGGKLARAAKYYMFRKP